MTDCELCEPTGGSVRLEVGVNAHRECMLRSAVGGIGHLIAHDWWCDIKHDPDAGLTYRQSALLVDEYVAVVGIPGLARV